jgi:hypothetical protein
MEVRGELALWRAVICQAILDAKDGKAPALRWLLCNNRDLRRVCDWAAVDVDALRKELMKDLPNKTCN